MLFPKDVKEPWLLVLDGTAMLFRAYYAMRNVPPSGGENVAAVMGVCQRLFRLMRDLQPDYVAVTFDVGSITFRNALEPTYKANRGEPPADLIPQFELVREAVGALGFAVLGVPDFEADDIMATLAKMSRDAGIPSVLMSVDKDICQLVSDAPPPTLLLDAKKDIYFDEAGVLERMGVAPQEVIEWQALVGDSVDNLPGVKGIGPKTAQTLIRHFGTLEEMYARLDEVATLPLRGAKGTRQKLEEGQERAMLTRRLVTLRDDVPLSFSKETMTTALRWEGPKEDADALFERLGFSRPLLQLRRLAMSF